MISCHLGGRLLSDMIHPSSVLGYLYSVSALMGLDCFLSMLGPAVGCWVINKR